MSVAELSAEQRRFRFEADMLAPLSIGARELIGRHAHVLFEVHGAAGIPDVVAASVDYTALLERADKDFLTSPTELAVVLFLPGCLGNAKRA